jgi:tetratricopeptide (TPR) repeat protein
MGELCAGLDELLRGRGGLFLVTGEPGIGKTRLADEVGRTASARGVSVHWGRAWEVGGAPSYWPVIQALRTMSTEGVVPDPAFLDPVGALRSELRGLVSPTQTPTERFELFERVDAFLRAATQLPRLMVLDDLHAADASSLQLLHFIARDLRSRPLMILGTYRQEEARLRPEIGALLARVAREASVLPLRRWDKSEVALFVERVTGRDPSADRVDELHRQTEGNPLFLRELLQLSSTDARHSDGIQQVLRARLSLLPHDSRILLEVAAVLGRDFFARPLAAVAGVPEVEARALLEPAAHAGIVEALDRPPRWRFTHVLLRQGLYDDLSAKRRAGLHHAAARDLMLRDDGSTLAEIAHHLAHAVPIARPIDAARAALRAADHAMDVLAFEDALSLYSSAEKMLEGFVHDAPVDGPEPRMILRAQFDATLGTGVACMRVAEVERGKQFCQRAAALARGLGDGDLFARAVLGPGYEHVAWSREATRIRMLSEALEMLPAADGALRAQCMAELAAIRHPEPDTGPLIGLAREAVAMARRVADPAALRATLSAASLAMSLFVDPADRIIDHRELLRLAVAAGDKRVALRAHGFLAGDFWEQGDRARAEPHIVAIETLAREFRHGRLEWLALIFRALDVLVDGRFEEARRLHADLEAILAQDEARGALLIGAPATIACISECYDDVARLEQRVRSAFGSIPDKLGDCLGEMLIAQLYARAGDRDRVQMQLEAVVAHPLFDAIREPTWLVMLADTLHMARDVAFAARIYPLLLPCAARFVWLGPINACIEPPFARSLGVLAQTLGRLDDAVRHFEDAEARTVQAGMRAHYARLWYELACALAARSSAGDRDRARGLLEQARTLAAELGQVGLVPRIETLLGELSKRRSAMSAGAAEAVPRSAAALAADVSRESRLIMSREGEIWALSWGERTIRIRDSRGVSLLAQLVECAGQELHVLQLVGHTQAAQDVGDAGPVLDPKAVQSYRARLLELREDVEDAERVGQHVQADKAREEIEFLTRELARAVGLAGRERRAAHPAERARTAVQKRLRDVVRRIEREIPELGQHLSETIRTGVFCAYLPERRRA